MAEITTDGDFMAATGARPKLPSGLNILTILTLIWSAYELYSGIKNFMFGQEQIDKLIDAQDKMANAPAWVQNMAGPEMLEIARKGVENKIPILVISLISVGLCVAGAIQMRQLKKQGYFLWLIGEILPWVATTIFLGTVIFHTIIGFFLIFPVLFIILYSTRRKYLVY